MPWIVLHCDRPVLASWLTCPLLSSPGLISSLSWWPNSTKLRRSHLAEDTGAMLVCGLLKLHFKFHRYYQVQRLIVLIYERLMMWKLRVKKFTCIWCIYGSLSPSLEGIWTNVSKTGWFARIKRYSGKVWIGTILAALPFLIKLVSGFNSKGTSHPNTCSIRPY